MECENSNNIECWISKSERNIVRDEEINKQLSGLGGDGALFLGKRNKEKLENHIITVKTIWEYKLY